MCTKPYVDHHTPMHLKKLHKLLLNVKKHPEPLTLSLFTLTKEVHDFEQDEICIKFYYSYNINTNLIESVHMRATWTS